MPRQAPSKEPSQHPTRARGEEGSRPTPSPSPALMGGADHPEEAKAPTRLTLAHEASPGPSSSARTHLDALPGKFWVLLLKLRDELIVLHLQQTQGPSSSARGLLWAGAGEAWPALLSRGALILAGAPGWRQQPLQLHPRRTQVGGRTRGLSSGHIHFSESQCLHL